jgi:hypothetical protein
LGRSIFFLRRAETPISVDHDSGIRLHI